MKTRRYVVAPGITADLCDSCYLRTIAPEREMTQLEHDNQHLTHAQYTAIQPHKLPTHEEGVRALEQIAKKIERIY
jgi:hypothetical protein